MGSVFGGWTKESRELWDRFRVVADLLASTCLYPTYLMPRAKYVSPDFSLNTLILL
jgi:hypothetical protein